MAENAKKRNVILRPHFKTHKSLHIANLQKGQGAEGFTVSTLREAEALLSSGHHDVTYAVPIDPGKIDAALSLNRQGLLSLTVDNLDVAHDLASAAATNDETIHVWLKVDCGYHRVGVDPRSEYALDLARFLQDDHHIIFDGILTHAGHAYHSRSGTELKKIAQSERDEMTTFKNTCEDAGVVIHRVSIGSTPTISAHIPLDGIDEIRPGNYVFYDATQMALGSCSLADCAVTVLATVISHQPGTDYVVIDAGALALSHDPGPTHLQNKPSRGKVLEGRDEMTLNNHLEVVSISQEHGILKSNEPGNLDHLGVGTKIRILPNHSCLTAALFDEYTVIENGKVTDRWPIMRNR